MKRFEGPLFNLCAQCGAELVAPIWAEHWSNGTSDTLWSCDARGYQFETSIYFPLSNEARRQVADRCVH
jgi:hypothetical protein